MIILMNGKRVMIFFDFGFVALISMVGKNWEKKKGRKKKKKKKILLALFILFFELFELFGGQVLR